VFSAVMELGVFGDGDGRLIVDAKGSGRGKRLIQLGELPKPNDFFCSMGCGDVFCFGAGEGDGTLFLGALGHGTASEHAEEIGH
jgi:hypothetical protein